MQKDKKKAKTENLKRTERSVLCAQELMELVIIFILSPALTSSGAQKKRRNRQTIVLKWRIKTNVQEHKTLNKVTAFVFGFNRSSYTLLDTYVFG